MRRVVITGGPATGKTSLIDNLKQKGHATFHEVAREVIKDQLVLKTQSVPWDDVTSFSRLVLKEQVEHFSAANSPITFFDRGIPDIIGYLNHGNKALFEELKTTSQQLRYSNIFILPPWEDIYATDNERRESFDDAVKLFNEIKSAYSTLNYQPILVPKISIEDRIKFILDHLNE